MHGNIEVQSDTDQKARTAIEIAMEQGGRIEGSSTGGQPSGAHTEAGKGRTDVVAQPVGPSIKVGKGGNYDGGECTTADDEFTEVKRKEKPKGDFGNENMDVVRSIADLEITKAVILGNHDAWNTQKFSGSLGDEHVGYRRMDLPMLKLSIVGGRPFSCGCRPLFRKQLLKASLLLEMAFTK
ncbi:hypothetical protein K7X08_011507 [Anisodus acutangulus]|uniref:Uncharacterized protein n=1 Tax=Anisodus acutangulus TaxID=402998 RepID=A0A9Q1MK45_9SOLA|nr:hypothetical protein K7X08_011507 [Anisodus acutangulus]